MMFDMFEKCLWALYFTVEHWEAVEGVPGLQRHYWLYYTSCKDVRLQRRLSLWFNGMFITQGCDSYFRMMQRSTIDLLTVGIKCDIPDGIPPCARLGINLDLNQ